jgi:hypothetical protein
MDQAPDSVAWLPQPAGSISLQHPEPFFVSCWLPVSEVFPPPTCEPAPWYPELVPDPGTIDGAYGQEVCPSPCIDPLTGIDEQDSFDEQGYIGPVPAEEWAVDDFASEEPTSEWPLHITCSLTIATDLIYPIYTSFIPFVEANPVLILNDDSRFTESTSWLGEVTLWTVESSPWLGEGDVLEPVAVDPEPIEEDPILIVCPPLQGLGKEPNDATEKITFLPFEFPQSEVSQEAPPESPPETAAEGEPLLQPIRLTKPYFRAVATGVDPINPPVVLAEPDSTPRIIGGGVTSPDLQIQNPSGGDPLAEYKSFLAKNPHWLDSHRLGDFELQVVTPSTFLPSIELATPSAARAFDAWYALIQLPPAAPPLSETTGPSLPQGGFVICFPDDLPSPPPPSASETKPGSPLPLSEPQPAPELPLADPVLPASTNQAAPSSGASNPGIVSGSEFSAEPSVDSSGAPAGHPPLDPIVDSPAPIQGADPPPCSGEGDLLLVRRSRAPLPEDLTLLPVV